MNYTGNVTIGYTQRKLNKILKKLSNTIEGINNPIEGIEYQPLSIVRDIKYDITLLKDGHNKETKLLTRRAYEIR